MNSVRHPSFVREDEVGVVGIVKERKSFSFFRTG